MLYYKFVNNLQKRNLMKDLKDSMGGVTTWAGPHDGSHKHGTPEEITALNKEEIPGESSKFQNKNEKGAICP